MRPSLRRNVLRLVPIAVIAATTLALTSSAPGITLYDGSYATDMSSSTPGGLEPASGTVLPYPTSDISLSWAAVPGANRYQLQIARQATSSADCSADAAFQLNNIALTTTVEDVEWVPSLESTEDGKDIWTGTYCWRVRTTGKGYGEWSTANRFSRTWTSTVTGLKFFNDHDGPVPRTSASSDWATGNTVTRNAGYATWDALPGASHYEVQVSPSPSFADSTIMVRRSGIRGTNVALLHLPDDTYFWRVRAIAPNGTEGNWSSGSNTFTVRWYLASWTDDAHTYPPDSSTQTELRVGWTAMPGASHYEFQAGTESGCFWNPDYDAVAPYEFGRWVQYQKDDSGLTRDAHPSHCRLTDIRPTTINNWVTFNDLVSDDVIENLRTVCYEDNDLRCEPAAMPYNYIQDFGAIYADGGAGVGNYYLTGDGQYSDAYSIYWRARPVFSASQEHETGWQVADGGYSAYGSWTHYTGAGSYRHHRFDLTDTPAFATTGTRCTGTLNPGDGCIENVGSTMAADEAPGNTTDASMQLPGFVWEPHPNASCYIIEIARDPLFNNIAHSDMIGWGHQNSYAWTESLPDNIEGTGYWWRVAPGWSDPDDYRCMQIYGIGSAGLPSSFASTIGQVGYVDMGVAQTFPKESNMQVDVVEGFEGANPLLRWTSSSVAATDYDGWSRGIEGTSYYEVQLARDPRFANDPIILNTTIPRIVPFQPAGGAGEGNENLPEGLWYYRVRAVDRNDVTGAWSSVGSFNKLIEAPVPQGSNGGSGPGVAVSWSSIDGASNYEIQWSDDSGFESDVETGTTLQTTFRIPGDVLGRRFWRVRAVVGGVAGQWSGQLRYVDVVEPTAIRYGLNRTRTLAKDRVQITGELKVAGTARNNERLRLQRKTGGCDSSSGVYVDSSVAITGDEADDGTVNIPARVVQNTCFRFAWANGAKTYYSAPIPAAVVPSVRAFKNRKVTRRSRPVCVSIRSNVAINGRWRMQYRAGKTWRTARSRMIRNKKAARTCVRFTKAGRYPTRVYFDKMLKSGDSWVQYDNVMRGMGIVRVNDVWRVVRSR